MDPRHNVQGDVLQVIPRRTPSDRPIDGPSTGSIRLQLAPLRRRRLRRVVLAAVAACGLILIAAGVARLAHANSVATAENTVPSASMVSAPRANVAVAGPVTAAPPVADVPRTGTLRLQHPATAGKVWLDGQKITTASTAATCGTHQIKVGTRGKLHAIDVPCGGDVNVSR